MAAYAIARLWDVKLGPEIKAYLEGIDDTLAPFEGKFIIHGGERTVLEGRWTEDLIVIAFPDLARAREWYRSPDYQKILSLRTENSAGDVIVIDGVPPDHKATDILGGIGH
ncbi:DUF1330 domain-containing protein [Trinickia diaoshuihuensis]|uniref:DUF1330 domain-containing protein n=1 Tax=Trinickia diaoshuihuensis TaxID=2292265 RepID=UPI000E21F2CC|nr:DUF1330 domain-containing protein [Trinickia diaoshuihuensis]